MLIFRKNRIKREEVLRPQHFYNNFTTNHKWLVVIGSNYVREIYSNRKCANF